MDSITNTRRHNLEDYEKVRKTFTWGAVAGELSGLPDKKGLNIAHEAVDRHAQGPLKDTLALRCIRKNRDFHDFTYAELKVQTSKFANVLKNLGIEKGGRVFSFAGRIPELYITALGALKHRAVFCPLFSVFGPEPVFQRLSRGDAAVLVTTSLLFEKKVSQLLGRLPSLHYIILTDIPENISEKVLSFSKLMEKASEDFQIQETNLEDAALLHFTSGTTGMPKGVLHVHQAVLTHYITGKYVLDFHEGDIFWCTADPGWVTGTSYGIVSPLVNGVSCIVDEEEFDGIRWYSILEQHQVSIWYTAPTAIRRLMRMDINPRDHYHLENLRLILSVGEPLHAEGVVWGKEKFGMPILDNWWQTETGGIMIANYSSMEVKPGSMGKPLPGVEIGIAEVRDQVLTFITEPNIQGHLVLKRGFPSLFRAYIHEADRF